MGTGHADIALPDELPGRPPDPDDGGAAVTGSQSSAAVPPQELPPGETGAPASLTVMVQMTADLESVRFHWGIPHGQYIVNAWIHDRQENWTARHRDDPEDAEPITARSAEVLRMRIRRDYQQRTGPVTGENAT